MEYVMGFLVAAVLFVFFRFHPVVAAIIGALVCLSLAPSPAEAAGYRGGSSRGYSAPRQTYRPAPKPTVTRNVTVNKTVVNKTTVVQQNRHIGSQGTGAGSSSSGMGSAFLGSVGGSIVGTGIGQWLFGPKEQPVQQPQAVPQEAPVEPVQPACDATLYDCTPKVPK